MDGAHSSLRETQMFSSGSKQGGWITFPFITGAVLGLSLASSGMMENVIVYLIREFNIKSIAAAQIANVVNGCTSLFPVVGAIIADSFFGSFAVASISSCVSLLGTVLLILTATLNSLRPHSCNDGSRLCKPPTGLQYAALYVGLALTAIGFGGTRFTTAALGANQFDKPADQGIFFNWFFFAMHVGSMVSMTGIFYIEGEVSWALGFGLCAVANLIALAILLLGHQFYLPDKPQGSPFVDLARVLVAAVRKWKCQLSSSVKDYYRGHDRTPVMEEDAILGKRLRFFNRAALIIDGDIESDGSTAKPWRLCSVQQVEDFKTLIGVLPLWSTSIFLCTPIGIQTSLAILQALTMDRHLGSHFKIPAGSISVVIVISTAIALPLVDRVLFPAWQKLIGKSSTPLQRIGVGHVFNVLGMAVAALVESKRLKIVQSQQLQEQPNVAVAMSALWLFPQLILVGIGVAFHFPGQVVFYYQQFPESLRSTSTAMISLIMGIGFYLSTALIDLVRRATGWLPDDINYGRVDYMYWILVVLGGINLGYYLVCSTLYRHQRV